MSLMREESNASNSFRDAELALRLFSVDIVDGQAMVVSNPVETDGEKVVSTESNSIALSLSLDGEISQRFGLWTSGFNLDQRSLARRETEGNKGVIGPGPVKSGKIGNFLSMSNWVVLDVSLVQ